MTEEEVFKLADKVAELQLRGRRVDNCWRLHVTLVTYGAERNTLRVFMHFVL